MKKLSIIVPIYNGEKHLDRLLDSMSLSELGNEIEVILVNDGSTDSSEEICLKWKYQYPDSIKYILKENGGVCSARNKGIENVTGKYYGFADQDDFYESGAVRILLEKITTMQSDMLIFAPQTAYESGKKREYPLPVEDGIWQGKELYRKVIVPMTFGIQTNGRGYNYGLWNCLFRSSTMSTLRLDPYLRMGEDMTFIVQAMSKVSNIETLNKTLYNWFCNQKSVSHTYVKSSELSITKTKYIYKQREDLMKKFPYSGWQKYVNANYASIIASFARNWTHRKSGETFFSTRKRILEIYDDQEIANHVVHLDYHIGRGKEKVELYLIKHRLVSALVLYFYFLHLYVGIRNGNMDSI